MARSVGDASSRKLRRNCHPEGVTHRGFEHVWSHWMDEPATQRRSNSDVIPDMEGYDRGIAQVGLGAKWGSVNRHSDIVKSPLERDNNLSLTVVVRSHCQSLC